MDLKKEILADYSKEHRLRIADFACASKANFKQLMQCFLSEDAKLAQYAASSISWAARKRPDMIMPYIKDLVAVLERKDVHDSLIRNAVRILQETAIPEDFHGEVMNACFNFIESPTTAIAIKAFSLTTLFNLSKTYPEIKPELKLIIEERWDQETAAFRSRGRKILAKLK